MKDKNSQNSQISTFKSYDYDLIYFFFYIKHGRNFLLVQSQYEMDKSVRKGGENEL